MVKVGILLVFKCVYMGSKAEGERVERPRRQDIESGCLFLP